MFTGPELDSVRSASRKMRYMNDNQSDENLPKQDPPKPSHDHWKRSLRVCHANMHMTPLEYGFWNVMREITAKDKYILDIPIRKLVVFFDNTDWLLRDHGKRATGINVPGEVRQSLIARGWLIPVVDETKFETNAYRVLSHEEWAAAHPGVCTTTLDSATDRLTHPPLQKPAKEMPTAALGGKTIIDGPMKRGKR
jgi:hypothetical protein